MPDSKLLTESLLKQVAAAIDSDTLLLGIQSGGVVVLDYLIKKLGIDVASATVDISLHRDDFEIRGLAKSKKSTSIDVDVNGRNVILVDDVLATGGTMRASEQLATNAGYQVIDSLCLLDIGILKNHDIKCLVSY